MQSTTSERKAEANRRNAAKSTGPRTPEGKFRSSQNATTHGCTATIITPAPAIFKPIRHEAPTLADQVRKGLLEAWKPANGQELQVIEIATAAYIRLQRAEAFEASLFSGVMDAIQQKHGRPVQVSENDDLGCGVAAGSAQNQDAFRNLDRYRRHAHLDYHRAVELLRRLQQDRRKTEARIPQTAASVASFRPPSPPLVRTMAAGSIIPFENLRRRLESRPQPRL